MSSRLLLILACLLMAAPLCAAETPATRTIVLVRHGYYLPDANADPKLSPHLAPIGVAQAHLAGARLADLPTRFDAMYVSPVQRARDTAAVIAADFPGRHFEVVDDLAECTPPTRRTEVTVDEKPAGLVACKQQFDHLQAGFVLHVRRPGGGRASRRPSTLRS